MRKIIETPEQRVARIKANNRRSYLKHRDERIAKAKANHLEHREERNRQKREHRRRPENIERIRARERAYKDAHREEIAARMRRNHAVIRLRGYGLTAEQYEAMLADQDRRCAICRRELTGRICIDHDHATGRVRGLLCPTCNTSLGGFRDNPRNLMAAVEYLAPGTLVAHAERIWDSWTESWEAA